MPDIPSGDPPERHQSDGGAVKSIIQVLAGAGLIAAAATGGRALIKRIPDSIRRKAEENITRTGADILDAINKHPSARILNKAIVDNPHAVNDKVLERYLKEVSQKSLGLLHAIETMTKTQSPDLLHQKRIHQHLISKYDLEIPELAHGAWQRMTLKDMWGAVSAGHLDIPGAGFLDKTDMGSLASRYGMSVKDLQGLRLDPNLIVNKSTGQIADLTKLNVPGRVADHLESITLLGIPIFRIRPDTRADKYGMAIFGRGVVDEDHIPHPLVRALTGKDEGQLYVLENNMYYRKDPSLPFELMEDLTGKFQVTADTRGAEFGLRSHLGTSEYDKIFLKGGTGKGLRGYLGIGPEYMHHGSHSVLGAVARIDKTKLDDSLWSRIKRTYAEKDPLGVAGMHKGPDPEHRMAGQASGLLARKGADFGNVTIKRTGLDGFLDWVNIQASRPYHLLEPFGIGIRPGKNLATTVLKSSAIAAGLYMGKEALSYADWATGNIASRGIAQGIGYGHYIRQELFDKSGSRAIAERIEEETPGLFSSALSQILRFGAIAGAGAFVGRAAGAPKFLRELFAGIARKGVGEGGWGRDVARAAIRGSGRGDRTSKAAGGFLGLAGGIAVGLGTLGDPSRDPSEVLQEVRGERGVAYKTSQGWLLGRDPFSGGNIRYHRPSFYTDFGVDTTGIGVYGSEGDKWRYGSWLPTAQNWLGLRRLFNPYYAEDRNVDTRPYPVTSGHFGDMPIIGPALEGTVGTMLKPRVYRDVNVHYKPGLNTTNLGTIGDINRNIQGAAGLELGVMTDQRAMFGAASMAQITAMGYDTAGMSGRAYGPNVTDAFANLSRNLESYGGLRGFQAQFLTRRLFGQEHPVLNRPILSTSGKMTSVSRSYYDAEIGGMFGMSEILRRAIVRPRGQPEINPILNAMPAWMPGSASMFEQDQHFYRDLSRGDPYTKIPLGEKRLPGPGRDALYSRHGGSAYSVVDAFIVLTDVAPNTQAHRVMGQEVDRLIRQGKLDTEWVRRVQIAKEQAAAVSGFRPFFSRKYTEDRTMHVGEVLSATEFRIKGMDDVVRLDDNLLLNPNISEVIARRQAEGMSASEAFASISRDRDKIRRRLEEMSANPINAQVTRVTHDATYVRIPEIQAMMEDMGLATESDLREQGLIGEAWTKAGKKVGELGMIAGAVMGLRKGKNIGTLVDAASAVGRVHSVSSKSAVGALAGEMFANKFTGDFTAQEHYERFQVYGTGFADWMNPYNSFFRPWVHTRLSTFADFTPAHRTEQYEREEYFDKLSYVKYRNLAQRAMEVGEAELAKHYNQQAGATLTGLDYSDLRINTPGLYQAIPANERDYLRQFAGERDPSVRRQIIDRAPDYMQSVYLAIWAGEGPLDDEYLESKYKQMVAPHLGTTPDERAARYFSVKPLPDESWLGWHPSVRMSDVKYKAIKMSGGSPHNHGLYDGQERRIEGYTAAVNPAARELVGLMNNRAASQNLWRRMSPDGNLSLNPASPHGNSAMGTFYVDHNHIYEEHFRKRAANRLGAY